LPGQRGTQVHLASSIDRVAEVPKDPANRYASRWEFESQLLDVERSKSEAHLFVVRKAPPYVVGRRVAQFEWLNCVRAEPELESAAKSDDLNATNSAQFLVQEKTRAVPNESAESQGVVAEQWLVKRDVHVVCPTYGSVGTRQEFSGKLGGQVA
jgi:hypothetical protein